MITPLSLSASNLCSFKPASDDKSGEKKAERKFQQGSRFSQRGETEKAIEKLEAALTLSSSPNLKAKTHNLLGMLYLQTGKVKKAKEHLMAAVVIDPNNVEYLKNLGIVCLASGDYQKAVATLKKANTNSPGNAEIVYFLAKAIFKNRMETLDYFDDFDDPVEDHTEIVYLLERVLEPTATFSIFSSSQQEDIYYMLAFSSSELLLAAASRMDVEAANTHLSNTDNYANRCLEINVSNAGCLALRGHIYVEYGYLSKTKKDKAYWYGLAIENFERAFDIEPRLELIYQFDVADARQYLLTGSED